MAMETETKQTLAQFVERNGIECTCSRADSNPANPDWKEADHWQVKFTRREATGKRYNARKDGTAIVGRMTTHFSMGYGHKGVEPRAEEVLSCLADDSSYLDLPFSEWARDLGYDPDSRKAEKIYRACERGAEKLKRFLGEELYQELMDTERL